ncbi:MAG: isochorismatase family protein [Paracoccaceae bacterium]|jgi:nicotinamidase-related amidase|nr:isochorismatase family protein [Paracoccaceae bacterium]
MPLIDPDRCALLVIDLQGRLMPAIDQSELRLANAARLIRAAEALNIRRHVTEQNPRGLGGTVAALDIPADEALPKMSFDSLRDPAIAARLAGDTALVVCGCEAHVCVLQTVLGLRAAGRQVFVVADACGSRTEANRQAGLARMQANGAEIVTTEMVIFEWLGSADHPAFKALMPLIK